MEEINNKVTIKASDSDKDERIFEYIKRILLKYHPIVDDRMDTLFGSSRFDILLDLYSENGNDDSSVSFMDGYECARTSILDYLELNDIFSLKVVCDLINYILADHDVVRSFYKTNSGIEFEFTVNLCDDNMHGIDCHTIGLIINFRGDKDMSPYLKYFLDNLVVTYFNKIKDTEYMKREIGKYISEIKIKFLEEHNKEDLLELLSKLSYSDLKYVVGSMDDNMFIEALNSEIEVKPIKPKVLTMHRTSDNCNL